jgi:transposase
MSKHRVYTAAEKVALLKKHLVEKVAVSDLCDQHQLHVNTFYHWLKTFFENGAAAFEGGVKTKSVTDAQGKKITQLEAKLARKNEVMAELLEEYTTLKKSLGDD